MIEGKYTNAARMVQQLSASHRWCVTGTPLQQGVHGKYSHLEGAKMSNSFLPQTDMLNATIQCTTLYYRNYHILVARSNRPQT